MQTVVWELQKRIMKIWFKRMLWMTFLNRPLVVFHCTHWVFQNSRFFSWVYMYNIYIYKDLYVCTNSTAQGGGGSFKNTKPIGEVGCCESRMAERSHWWTQRCLRSPLFLSLSLFFSLFLYLSLIIYLPTYWSICLPIYLSVCLSIYLLIYLSTYLSSCLVF